MNRMRCLLSLKIPALKFRLFLLALVPVLPLMADTVVLKNGKRFENVAARPLPGGRLEVTFVDGRKVLLKKDEVRSLYIAPTRSKPAPAVIKKEIKKEPGKSTTRREPRRTTNPRKARRNPARVPKTVSPDKTRKSKSVVLTREEYLKDLAGRTITAQNLAAETMAADTMAAGKMHAETITARDIIARRITVDTITAEVINARKIVSGKGSVLYSLEDVNRRRKAAASPGPAPWSAWSLTVPGIRFGERSHNWLVFGYLVTGSLIVAEGNRALGDARSDFDLANNLGLVSIVSNVTFGFDQTLGLLLFRDLRLAAANRGHSATSQMNLGALLILGAYIYNAWELKSTDGPRRRTRNARGTTLELNMNAGNRFAVAGRRDSEFRVKWFMRFQ